VSFTQAFGLQNVAQIAQWAAIGFVGYAALNLLTKRTAKA